jgi:hypothetical protein
MATFKVGQRVRIIAPRSPSCGREATIIGVKRELEVLDFDAQTILHVPIFYYLDIDGYGATAPGGRRRGLEPHEITPLTDPKADAFLERVKKLGREPAFDSHPDRRMDIEDGLEILREYQQSHGRE